MRIFLFTILPIIQAILQEIYVKNNKFLTNIFLLTKDYFIYISCSWKNIRLEEYSMIIIITYIEDVANESAICYLNKEIIIVERRNFINRIDL